MLRAANREVTRTSLSTFRTEEGSATLGGSRQTLNDSPGKFIKIISNFIFSNSLETKDLGFLHFNIFWYLYQAVRQFFKFRTSFRVINFFDQNRAKTVKKNRKSKILKKINRICLTF